MEQKSRTGFGNAIRILRERRGLTQRQLAQKARTSQSAIARMEMEEIDPRLSTVKRICETLDADVCIIDSDGGLVRLASAVTEDGEETEDSDEESRSESA